MVIPIVPPDPARMATTSGNGHPITLWGAGPNGRSHVSCRRGSGGLLRGGQPRGWSSRPGVSPGCAGGAGTGSSTAVPASARAPAPIRDRAAWAKRRRRREPGSTRSLSATAAGRAPGPNVLDSPPTRPRPGLPRASSTLGRSSSVVAAKGLSGRRHRAAIPRLPPAAPVMPPRVLPIPRRASVTSDG